MKKLFSLIITVLAIYLLLKMCAGGLGNITLPTGEGGGTKIELPGSGNTNRGGTTSDNSSTSGGSLEDWIRKHTGGSSTSSSSSTQSSSDIKEISEELERELGIGNKKSSNTNTSNRNNRNNNTTNTQTSSNTTLTFKGIPMGTSKSDFINKLVNQGFMRQNNNTLTGTFAGFDNCTLTLNGDPVQGVRVDFPVTNSWDKLESDYDTFQAALTQKYGDPFVNRNQATFNTSGGNILLDADVTQGNYHVILNYGNTSSSVSNGNQTRQNSGLEDLFVGEH